VVLELLPGLHREQVDPVGTRHRHSLPWWGSEAKRLAETTCVSACAVANPFSETPGSPR
jgi:hypothetical protein